MNRWKEPEDLPAPRPEEIEPGTQPSDERCDRAHVERAFWRLVSPKSGLTITLCRYHYRLNQVALAVDGWSAEELPERIEA